MFFSLDVRRARKGDCMLLHSGTKNDPALVLIDGGPSGVYKPELKPRIETIRKARELADEDPLIVDALMVSHVDDDHIHGLIELGNEEVDKTRAHQPRMLNVQAFWHNSFDEIIGHNTKEITAAVTGHFGLAAVSNGGDLPDKKKDEVVEASSERREVVESGLQVLASIEQGFRLRQIAEFLHWPPNPDFDGSLVVASKKKKTSQVTPTMAFTVIGPMQAEVDALRKAHLAWLKKLKKEGKSAPEALAAYVDKSVPNLSSLVVMAESGGKRILFTGDARGDKIIEGLQLVGLLAPGKKSKIEVDILKVPHHGSANNLDDDFFERVIASHYVFSGNGEHGNPEREALEMLLKARGKDPFTIHLTYSVTGIDKMRKADWEKEQRKEIKRNPAKARPDWSPKGNSLKALLAEKKLPSKTQKIAEVSAKGPHVIDLLDPLGF